MVRNMYPMTGTAPFAVVLGWIELFAVEVPRTRELELCPLAMLLGLEAEVSVVLPEMEVREVVRFGGFPCPKSQGVV